MTGSQIGRPAQRPLRHRGLYAAPFTPFRPDGNVAIELIPALVAHLKHSGLAGAFVCGSNGEGPSLSVDERKAVAEAWIDAAGTDFEIMVHVGHSSVREAQRLAEHAAGIGASAISAVAAFYFAIRDVARLADCLAEIASAAPATPFYYYHIPALTSVNLDVVGLLELAGDRISNFAGVKYTAPTLWEYQACLNAGAGRFDIMFGLDEMLLPALAVGAQAAIGSTYNFAGPLFRKVVDHYRAGRLDDARAQMARLVEMVRVMLSFPPIPAQKEIMRILGFDFGGCRLPLQQLTNEQTAELHARLEALGFWAELAAATAPK